MSSLIIPINEFILKGVLNIPSQAGAIVLFIHGSGSSRNSKRNQYIASMLKHAGLATLLFDLLTEAEEKLDRVDSSLRFNVDLLTDRVLQVTQWLKQNPDTKQLKLGYFGASTGSAAALSAAARLKDEVVALVSRGGRPDLATEDLTQVRSATLFIVGQNDPAVKALNFEAYDLLECQKEIEIISGASHLFEEPGMLEQVAILASDWFKKYLV